ncbi:MAG: hypothetical protein K0R79_4071 [Stenotrophomonas indicatrix]|nr:hypothetical protein [Stenotrophomonas indicatrix]
MVVWPKPCESRSSPGFIPRKPRCSRSGVFLCARETKGSAGRWPATTCSRVMFMRLPASGRHYRNSIPTRRCGAQAVPHSLEHSSWRTYSAAAAGALAFLLIIVSHAASNGPPSYPLSQTTPPGTTPNKKAAPCGRRLPCSRRRPGSVDQRGLAPAEHRYRLVQCTGLRLQFTCRRSGFFHQRRVLLRGLVHLHHRLVDLLDTGGLLL